MTNSAEAGSENTGGSPGQHDITLTVNAYLKADKAAQAGDESAAAERQEHLSAIRGQYWQLFASILSGNLVHRRAGLDFSDDERLFLDLGLVDVRMLGSEQGRRELLDEIKFKGSPGCYYLSEWLNLRHQQLQLETDLEAADDFSDNTYETQLKEARRRVLSRLAAFFTGLPGIPLEVSESMRAGELDRVIIAAGIEAVRNPKRSTFLRRRNLWALREQIIAKARARANSQGVLRLFEMLNEIYTREWRTRYDSYLNAAAIDTQNGAGAGSDANNASVGDPNIDAMMSEARQMRMRMVLMEAIDGNTDPDPILHVKGLRVGKQGLAAYLPVLQAFDRMLTELPPIVIVPGSGRGFFAWESGTIMLALRPLVGLDDSVATAFAWQRMLDDRFNQGGALRSAYENKFPGAVFNNDFPADYRAWMCRLTKGEAAAMDPQRRAFFRDLIGPDLSGPLLPPNLRNIGPQTMVAICRRLEKQVAAGESDVNHHRRLAAIYWQQGNMEAAGLQFNAAMQIAPHDGETMFSAGMFMRANGDGEAASDCFRFGAERAGNSLWGIYCQDALANLV